MLYPAPQLSMPVVPSQVTLGNGPPPSVSPAHQRILVPQHIWGNHPGQPSFPTYCIPTIWFTRPDAPGIPLRELLDSPKDILRSRIPGYRDQRILEVLHSHIRLIISVSTRLFHGWVVSTHSASDTLYISGLDTKDIGSLGKSICQKKAQAV